MLWKDVCLAHICTYNIQWDGAVEFNTVSNMQIATHEKIGGAFFPSFLPCSPWSFPLISILHTFFSFPCKSHSDFGKNPLLVPLYSTFFILYPFTSLSKSGEIPSFDPSVFICLSLVTSIPPFFQSLLLCPEFTCFLFFLHLICNEWAHSRADQVVRKINRKQEGNTLMISTAIG